MSETQASNQQPWMKVAATLGYQRSKKYITTHTYMRELAELQASYGLSDSQIVEALYVGHKKYKLNRSGDSYTKVSMGNSEETVKQMAGVAQNANNNKSGVSIRYGFIILYIVFSLLKRINS